MAVIWSILGGWCFSMGGGRGVRVECSGPYPIEIRGQEVHERVFWLLGTPAERSARAAGERFDPYSLRCPMSARNSRPRTSDGVGEDLELIAH